MNDIKKSMLIIGFVGICASFGAIYIIALYIYDPLKRLQFRVESLDYYNLGEAIMHTRELGVGQKADREIVLLNRAFDAMLDRLKNSIDRTICFKAQTLHATFQALQAQINPHFLYNTIAVISIMAKEVNEKNIPVLCERLIEMLKYSSNSERTTVTLGEEVQNVSHYLELMSYRYEHRLKYKIEMEDGISDCLVPKLILQPAVENSLKHGLYGLAGNINVRVKSWKDADGRVVIIIEDNGAGMNREKLLKIKSILTRYDEALDDGEFPSQPAQNGMGLVNTFGRLKVLFQQGMDFNIHCRPEGGTTVSIRVPALRG